MELSENKAKLKKLKFNKFNNIYITNCNIVNAAVQVGQHFVNCFAKIKITKLL